MFMGEALCLLAYYTALLNDKKTDNVQDPPADIDESNPLLSEAESLHGFKNLILWIPTLCKFFFLSFLNFSLNCTQVI
jgi:hypothetical protein